MGTKKAEAPLSSAQRMAKTRAARMAAGLRQINVWVPASEVQRVRAYAQRLVKEAQRG